MRGWGVGMGGWGRDGGMEIKDEEWGWGWGMGNEDEGMGMGMG